MKDIFLKINGENLAWRVLEKDFLSLCVGDFNEYLTITRVRKDGSYEDVIVRRESVVWVSRPQIVLDENE